MLHKFLQALPSWIASVIISQRDLTPASVGKLVDELMPLLNNVTVFVAPQYKPDLLREEYRKHSCITPVPIEVIDYIGLNNNP